jgi:hypothetical protein
LPLNFILTHVLELQLNDFLNNYMSLNGRLLIRFVKEHAGVRVTAKLVRYLTEFWKHRPADKLAKFEREPQTSTEKESTFAKIVQPTKRDTPARSNSLQKQGKQEQV